MSETPEITQLLQKWSAGDEDALEKLVPIIYAELHRIARRYMIRERDGHTLQTTALVNEAYLTAARGELVEHPQAQLDVAEQAALLGRLDLGAEGELARSSEVVDDGRGDQQLLVQARVERGRLDGQRGHGHGVLEQAADVG